MGPDVINPIHFPQQAKPRSSETAIGGFITQKHILAMYITTSQRKFTKMFYYSIEFA